MEKAVDEITGSLYALFFSPFLLFRQVNFTRTFKSRHILHILYVCLFILFFFSLRNRSTMTVLNMNAYEQLIYWVCVHLIAVNFVLYYFYFCLCLYKSVRSPNIFIEAAYNRLKSENKIDEISSTLALILSAGFYQTIFFILIFPKNFRKIRKFRILSQRNFVCEWEKIVREKMEIEMLVERL